MPSWIAEPQVRLAMTVLGAVIFGRRLGIAGEAAAGGIGIARVVAIGAGIRRARVCPTAGFLPSSPELGAWLARWDSSVAKNGECRWNQ